MSGQYAIGAPYLGTAVGYVQVTPATATTPTLPPATKYAWIIAEAQAVRFRDDGEAPTATVGFLLPVGVPYLLSSENLAKFECIAATAGAILNFLCYA